MVGKPYGSMYLVSPLMLLNGWVIILFFFDNDIRNSGGVGRGDVDQTSNNVIRLSNDDTIDNNNATESTNNHQEEDDDDNEDEEEVQILTESFRELGFDEGEIHHKKELYIEEHPKIVVLLIDKVEI